MDGTNNSAADSGINRELFLYILFRHKWKILLLSLLGLAAALSLPFILGRSYESHTKLFVRYVPEPEPIQLGGAGVTLRPADIRLETLMNTEVEILTTLNLAQRVVDVVGADKIMGVGGADRTKAALVLLKGLNVQVARSTSVLNLAFKHRNPEIVQPVVQQWEQCYLKKHQEAHAVGFLELGFSRELDERQNRLRQTREELEQVKARIGVTSLEEAKRSYNEQIAKVRQQIYDAEVEVAEDRAALEKLSQLTALPHSTAGETIQTNPAPAVPEEAAAEYRTILSTLANLKAKLGELLTIYTSSNSVVKVTREQIAQNDKSQRELETRYPALVLPRFSDARPSSSTASPGRQLDLEGQMIKLTSAQARLDRLKESMVKVREDTAALLAAETRIRELETRLEVEEAQYKGFIEKQDKIKTEERLGAGRVLNISVVEPASPPIESPSKLGKMMALVFAGAVLIAFGLAFVTELYLDTTIKRPRDLTRFRLPLLLSIPLLNGKRAERALEPGLKTLLPEPGSDKDKKQGSGGGGSALVSWGQTQNLSPFSEGLRNRLMTWFEARQMTHKPKLVGVTSCGQGAGVSCIAAGLAASLSKTGEGSVLLVDMRGRNGEARQFRHGEMRSGLDEALEKDKRRNALVLENLYVVSETATADELPTFLPTRLKALVPRLKASDYDYIIFDLPPVSQISLTPRLSSFMDLMLVVVESERTEAEALSRATALLSESETKLGVVLNKCRSHLPRSCQHDL